VHLHLGETEAEAQLLRAQDRPSAMELCARTGLLEQRLLLAHGVWLTTNEVELLVASGAAVAHNPASNAKLASGIAPITEFRRAGLTVSLGTDGPASNDRLDLFEDLRLAIRLARLQQRDPSVFAGADGLALATRAGGHALGLAIGELAPGMLADFVRLDLNTAWSVTELDAAGTISQVIFSATGSDVTDVVVGGRRIVDNGTVIGADPDLLTRARRRAAALGRASSS
jgi:5-methylthioadenosine/S-adenosylhomocysteine deaminase